MFSVPYKDWFSRTNLCFAGRGEVSALEQDFSKSKVRVIVALLVVEAVFRRHFSHF